METLVKLRMSINSIAGAIKAGLEVYANWQKSREKRRLKACIEAGETYIHVNEGDGEYKEMTDKRRKQRLRTLRKRFFKYNQG